MIKGDNHKYVFSTVLYVFMKHRYNIVIHLNLNHYYKHICYFNLSSIGNYMFTRTSCNIIWNKYDFMIFDLSRKFIVFIFIDISSQCLEGDHQTLYIYLIQCMCVPQKYEIPIRELLENDAENHFNPIQFQLVKMR